MAKYLINYLEQKSKINKEIYGNFTEHLGRCIYDGIWVGKDSAIPNVNGVRKDIIDAFKEIKLPVLRWPGGCFADQYHWKDGIGPMEQRKRIVNKTWGDAVEDNSFGTHEFMDMCEEIGCDAYIAGNLATGSIQEMLDWIEYITGDGDSEMANLRRKNGREKPWKLTWFGIGNEVWGCGGEMMPDYYVNQYRQAYHFLSQKGFMTSGSLKFIASGPGGDDYEWTDKVTDSLTTQTYCMSQIKSEPLMDGLSFHHYVYGGDGYFNLRRAREFDERQWYDIIRKAAEAEELIIRHDTVMTRHDPEKKVGLMIDEWGAWYGSEEGTNPAFLFQQNTMCDAVIAAVYLNIFNKHSDRIKLATIAQAVNVLQSVVLTEGEKMVLTPTYHVFELFKKHQDATLLGSYIESREIGVEGAKVNNLFESSSTDADGNVTATICNTSIDNPEQIEATLFGAEIESVKARILAQDAHACNTFEEPENVAIKVFDVIYSGSKIDFEIPAGSVVELSIRVK